MSFGLLHAGDVEQDVPSVWGLRQVHALQPNNGQMPRRVGSPVHSHAHHLGLHLTGCNSSVRSVTRLREAEVGRERGGSTAHYRLYFRPACGHYMDGAHV